MAEVWCFLGAADDSGELTHSVVVMDAQVPGHMRIYGIRRRTSRTSLPTCRRVRPAARKHDRKRLRSTESAHSDGGRKCRDLPLSLAGRLARAALARRFELHDGVELDAVGCDAAL